MFSGGPFSCFELDRFHDLPLKMQETETKIIIIVTMYPNYAPTP